jgi:hypothetical protein
MHRPLTCWEPAVDDIFGPVPNLRLRASAPRGEPAARPCQTIRPGANRPHFAAAVHARTRQCNACGAAAACVGTPCLPPAPGLKRACAAPRSRRRHAVEPANVAALPL